MAGILVQIVLSWVIIWLFEKKNMDVLGKEDRKDNVFRKLWEGFVGVAGQVFENSATGNDRFRTATDLVVGGFDFGSGVTSFVAARQFVTSTAALTHTFNGMGINLTGSTPDASRIFSSRFQAGALQTCTDAYIYAIASCPTAAATS